MSQIKFTDNGTEYTLEFDRASVAMAERSLDISLNDLIAGKVTMYPALFQAAFQKHHRRLKPSKIEKFYKRLENKDELIQTLIGMYAETANTLLDEPEEGNGLSWKAV